LIVANPRSVIQNGNELLILMDDNTRKRALAMPGEFWQVAGVDAPPPPPPPPDPAGPRFAFPFPLSTIIYEFGPRWGRLHAGIDMAHGAASNGAIIKAAGPGVVEGRWTTGQHGGYGNCILLRHGSGRYTLYGHMQNGSFLVSKGDRVVKGTPLGKVGSTGQSQGPHLHFETHEGGYRWNASARNPRTTLPKWNK